jgi:hypothetical protein
MDWATSGATLLLVGVGSWQIAAIRKENRLERTLSICSRYESDVVLERCVKTLRDAQTRKEFGANPKVYFHEVVMVLNWLDTIAIGIKQGLFEEKLARDHTESIVKHYKNTYLTPNVLSALEIDSSDFQQLAAMADDWCRKKSHFGNVRTWWRFS